MDEFRDGITQLGQHKLYTPLQRLCAVATGGAVFEVAKIVEVIELLDMAKSLQYGDGGKSA